MRLKATECTGDFAQRQHTSTFDNEPRDYGFQDDSVLSKPNTDKKFFSENTVISAHLAEKKTKSVCQ